MLTLSDHEMWLISAMLIMRHSHVHLFNLSGATSFKCMVAKVYNVVFTIANKCYICKMEYVPEPISVQCCISHGNQSFAFCRAKQISGSYRKCNTGMKWDNQQSQFWNLTFTHFIQLNLNSFMTEVPIIYKPVHWLAL